MARKPDMQEAIGVTGMKDVVAEVICDRFSEGGWLRTAAYMPREMELTIYVNEKALVTILCTAAKLDYLVFGYLYAEGIISCAGDVASVRLSKEESLADVRLKNPRNELPTLRKLGCSGSSIFKTQGQRVNSDLVVAPEEVLSLMQKLQEQMELYPISGGVHTSALSDTKNLLVVAEDIGRHNTLNKIQGECLLRGIPTRDRLVLITGRISSEMLLKAARMETPVVVSRHAPTENAILLARDLGITLVGQARNSRLAVFTHLERLCCLTN
ncbi:MAG: formate dehydrogenase accessory sulfurtransferase FdhD [Desulfotomaculaceae bacterium]|nr:formate dehydrogenase accessory sulfurtransferase FdhD [Desulfotomaculaceae bacterium]